MYQKLIIFAALLLTVNSYAQNTKLNLAEGKKYEITATLVTASTGGELDVSMNGTYVQMLEVKKNQSGQADLVVTMKRIINNSTIYGDDTDVIDTDDENCEEQGAIMKKLIINNPKNFTANTAGVIIKEDQAEIENISGIDVKADIIRGVNNIMQSGTALFCASLIGRPFTVGASWTDSVKVERPNQMNKSAGVFTVKSVENNTAVIAFNGTASDITIAEYFNTITRAETKSTVSGEVKIDLATGIILESNSTSEGVALMEPGGKNSTYNVKNTYTTKTKIL